MLGLGLGLGWETGSGVRSGLGLGWETGSGVRSGLGLGLEIKSFTKSNHTVIHLLNVVGLKTGAGGAAQGQHRVVQHRAS